MKPDNIPDHATRTDNPDGSISWQWNDSDGCNTYTTNLPPTAPIYFDPTKNPPIPPTKGTTMTHNPYKAAGFENRRDYLESLTEDYPADVVFALADILGPGEDFDGLITALEDAAESGEL